MKPSPFEIAQSTEQPGPPKIDLVSVYCGSQSIIHWLAGGDYFDNRDWITECEQILNWVKDFIDWLDVFTDFDSLEDCFPYLLDDLSEFMATKFTLGKREPFLLDAEWFREAAVFLKIPLKS